MESIVYGCNSVSKLKKLLQLPEAAKPLNIMISYHYVPKNKNLKEFLGDYFHLVEKGQLIIWIDSGAFSAFKKGVKIDLFSFMKWLRINEKFIYKYMALDSITNEAETANNYRIMLENGLNPVPVFHRFDSRGLLKMYAQNTNNIALGTRAPFDNDDQRRAWLTNIFAAYKDLKFHCLGFIESDLFKEFDFDSCDSCTWEIEEVAAKLAA
jgi:hypothetical protein